MCRSDFLKLVLTFLSWSWHFYVGPAIFKLVLKIFFIVFSCMHATLYYRYEKWFCPKLGLSSYIGLGTSYDLKFPPIMHYGQYFSIFDNFNQNSILKRVLRKNFEHYWQFTSSTCHQFTQSMQIWWSFLSSFRGESNSVFEFNLCQHRQTWQPWKGILCLQFKNQFTFFSCLFCQHLPSLFYFAVLCLSGKSANYVFFC